MWTEPEWRSFCLLLDRGFPGDFDDADREAYRVFLDKHEPAAVMAALERWAATNGKAFRPSASDLLGAVAADPTAPTFAEMEQLVFGPGGIMHAQPAQRHWASEHERRGLVADAITQRAEAAHPLVAAFVRSQGIERLRRTNLDDPDWGHKRRADLKAEWDDFCERASDRQALALTQGRAPAEGLHRFDPLAALGAGRKQITEGKP